MGQFDEKFNSGKSVYLWLHINVVKDEFNQITNYIDLHVTSLSKSAKSNIYLT